MGHSKSKVPTNKAAQIRVIFYLNQGIATIVLGTLEMVNFVEVTQARHVELTSCLNWTLVIDESSGSLFPSNQAGAANGGNMLI